MPPSFVHLRQRLHTVPEACGRTWFDLEPAPALEVGEVPGSEDVIGAAKDMDAVGCSSALQEAVVWKSNFN